MNGSGIDLQDLVIDAEATLGKIVYVRAAYPTYVYSNGTPTANRDGTRYRVMSRAGTLNVKVPGAQTLTVDGASPIPVSFEGVDLYIYYRDGKPFVAGRAKAVHVVGKDA